MNKKKDSHTSLMKVVPEFIQEGPFKESEIGDGVGCDGFYMALVNWPKPGEADHLEMTVTLFSRDGRNQTDMADRNLLKIWAVIANVLAQSKELDESEKKVPRLVVKSEPLMQKGPKTGTVH